MSKHTIFYTNHAVKQMFQRNISTHDVENVLDSGEAIMLYPEDKPWPSKLLFLTIDLRPIHVVCSYNSDKQSIIVITAYEPSDELWDNDFKTRKIK